MVPGNMLRLDSRGAIKIQGGNNMNRTAFVSALVINRNKEARPPDVELYLSRGNEFVTAPPSVVRSIS